MYSIWSTISNVSVSSCYNCVTDCSPGLSVEESPDGGLGPSACKRMALEDSSDLSDRATPNRSENSSSSSFSFNANIRKRLFKGGSRKRYPFLRRGKKTVENGKLNNKHEV